jgi:hypothetical protein
MICQLLWEGWQTQDSEKAGKHKTTTSFERSAAAWNLQSPNKQGEHGETSGRGVTTMGIGVSKQTSVFKHITRRQLGGPTQHASTPLRRQANTRLLEGWKIQDDHKLWEEYCILKHAKHKQIK